MLIVLPQALLTEICRKNPFPAGRAFLPQRLTYRSDKGHLLAAFHSFSTTDEFEQLIEKLLRDWLRPDPKAPKMTWVHWVLYNLPPSVTGLKEGVKGNELPAGTMAGLNDWKRPGYGGPCPPIGRHRYFFKLYALDAVLTDLTRPDKAAVEAAMRGHIVAQATLIGTYEKTR